MGLAFRVLLLPGAPDTDDSLLFVRGVERFSLAELRPHWPGYPVYVWVGKLVALMTGDAMRALHLVSAAASAFVAWPLGLVARAWALSLGSSEPRADWAGWGAAALWLVTPVSWVTGSQIASDPLGLLFGAAVLVLCLRGAEGRRGSWLAAAALGGVTVGVRVVNFTMLGPVAAEAWRRRRERWNGVPAVAALALAFTAGVLPWMAWLLAREPAAFHAVGQRIVTGHFNRWGGTVLTDPDLAGRPLRAARTLAVYGVGAGTPGVGWIRPLVGVAWLVTLWLALAQRPWRGRVARVVALWAVPHLAYVFLGQAVESHPRYMLSGTAVLAILAGLAVVRRGGWAAVLAATVVTAAVAGPLAARQHNQLPPEYRAARFLAGHVRPAVMVVDAPEILAYLQRSAPDVLCRAASASEVGKWQERWTAEGRTVFATAPPAPDPSGWRPVARFCRDPLIDPIRGREVWLFAPAPAGAGAGTVEGAEECLVR